MEIAGSTDMPAFTLILTKRLLSHALALLLLLWGGYGLYLSDWLILPLFEKADSSSPQPAYLTFSAFICGAMMLTSSIIDQYELKNSESAQPSLARYVGWFGWFIFLSALLFHFLLQYAHLRMN
jgi:hypothetical protein